MRLTIPWTVTDAHLNGVGTKLDEVRQSLGREVDHLAQVASQVSHDASAQAGAVARDTSKETGAVMNRLIEGAAALGPTIAVMGRQRMRGLGRDARSLGRDARSLGHELRQVRLTTEPVKTGRDLLPGIALLGGLGIGIGTGIALMYLLDPDRGRRRRQTLMGRLARLTSAGREAAAQKANALANRTVGVMADVRRSVTTGIGVDQDAPVVVEPSSEEWPEGTRIPVG